MKLMRSYISLKGNIFAALMILFTIKNEYKIDDVSVPPGYLLQVELKRWNGVNVMPQRRGCEQRKIK